MKLKTTLRPFLIIYLLGAVFFTSHAQSTLYFQYELDSLQKKYSKEMNVTDSVQSNLKNLRRHIAKAKKEKQNEAEGLFSSLLAEMFIFSHEISNIDSTLFYRNRAISSYEKINNKSKLAHALSNMGVTLKDYGRYTEGEEYLFQSQKISERIGLHTQVAANYRILCDLCGHRKDFYNAVKYGEMSIAYAIKHNLLEGEYYPIMCLVSAYTNNGNPEIAVEKATQFLEAINKGIVSQNAKYFMHQQRATAYLALGMKKEAIADVEQITNPGTFSEKYFENLKFSRLFFLKKKYAKALPHLKRKLKIDMENSEWETYEDLYSKIIYCYQQLGDFESASKYQTSLYKVRQERFNNEIESTRTELLEKYEANKKESTIIAQKQSIKLEKRNTYVGLVASVLLLLLCIGLIWLYLKNKKQNKKLEKITLQLQKVDHFKNQFYSNISHEFRTPLTVIMGITENIHSHKKEKDLILRNSENLLQLVTQLLDLSKMESGNVFVNSKHGNIINYIKYLTESFYSLAAEKNIEITIKNRNKELMMDYDEKKMQQIIYNLLSNAIKFTPNGGKISLHVKKVETIEGENLILKVIDTGIGIAPKEAYKLFDKFYQVDNSHTRKYEGTGIGLTFTRELIKLMGGTIDLKSVLGKGSEFIITLPIFSNAEFVTKTIHPKINKTHLDRTVKKEVKISANKLQKDLPVLLIVEDNKDVRNYIVSLLDAKYQVLVAKNGQLGIDKALEIIPDVIISDLMMPIKTGYDLCNTLKQDDRTSHIPIILLTANANQDARIEGLKYGADAYVTKPFNKEELLVRLNNLIKIRRKLQKHFIQEKLIKKVPLGKEKEHAFIENVYKTIHKSLGDASFGVAELYLSLKISETHAYRKIKALTGKSPLSLIRLLRLRKAKQLLIESNLTISEISYTVGFKDPNYFSRVFLKEFDKNPKSVRKPSL